MRLIFSHKHLTQLRDFIQLGLSKEITHLGDPGIMKGGGTAADLIGIFHHGTEFTNPECFSQIAAPLRPVKNRETVLGGNQNRNNQKKGPQQQASTGNQNIQNPLDEPVINSVICRFIYMR
mgnify:CR=1 FL=1